MGLIDYFHHRYVEKFGKKINKICEPFFTSNGMSYFSYLKIRKDGRFIFLNTDQDYSSEYFNQNFLSDEILLTHPDTIQSETLILSTTLSLLYKDYIGYDNLIKFAVAKFNYDHFFAFFQKKNDFSETFVFASDPKNIKIISNYTHNLKEYKLFSKY